MRYKVNRIGFVNFWLYDEEDFYFYDGKLLLRGTNGSGKTVTMQSFFPLIFDGNKSPERLDSFGSRDRKIEDYLISEDFPGNENTGYLYMEFIDKEENKYLTIGIGLRAIKNRTCEFWGFSITDGRRIGDDFLLFKERNLRIPLTKKELQNRIGTGGEFTETAKEYKKMVNKLLFGFSNIGLYTEFINLLIQIRSPKLSNDTKPSQLSKVLTSVLEPLSEDDLRVMADSIEDMNKYKEKLLDLQNEQKACNNLMNAFMEYNKAVLYNKGDIYLKYKQEYLQVAKTIKDEQQNLENIRQSNIEQMEIQKNLELEKQELEHRKSKLEETDLKSISNQLDEIILSIKELDAQINLKENEQKQKEQALAEKKKALTTKENELYTIESEFDSELKELTDYEDDIQFDDAKFYLDDLKKERFKFKQMQSYVNTLKRQTDVLSKLKDISYMVYQKELEVDEEKEKYFKSDSNLKEIQKQKVQVSNELLEQAENLKEGLAKVSLENRILKLTSEQLNSIYQIIDDLDREMFLKIKEIIKNEIFVCKDKLKLEISNNNIKINEYESLIANLNEELSNVDGVLFSNLDDEVTKEYFDDNNINYNYLFELIDFKENISVSDKKRIESFLIETGIITSFVTDALVSDASVKVKCLTEREKVNDNLTKYLVALDTPFKDRVNRILESISVSDDHFIKLLSNGEYEYALLKGKVDISHDLKYIGAETRKAYIEVEKEKISIHIKQLTREINSLQEENIGLNSDINSIDDEFNNFSFPNDIIDTFKKLDKINLDEESISDSISKILDVIKKKNAELKIIEDELNENKHGYYGSLKYQDISDVLRDTSVYLEILKALNNSFDSYIAKEELITFYKQGIEDINLDLDNIKYELDDANFKLTTLQKKKQNINDILNSDKYKDVGLEYSRIKERLLKIEEELKSKISVITKNETTIDFINKEIDSKNMELVDKDLLKQVSFKVFMDEYNLHYVKEESIDENEIYHFVKSIKQSSQLRDIYEKFNDCANKNLSLLFNYASKYIYLHDVDENAYLNFTNDDSKKDLIINLLEGAKRKDLVFNYLGKNVNLIELSRSIDSSINNYQNLISDENRRLFEDLLINNIGSSIRTKIFQSEEWIKEVRELMESMNTSSGLSFSLKWVGASALTEDELDTKEIVDIFKKEANNLKEEHLVKVTNHFKSKIQMREDALEESERNYLEIIKDVLDYRKWFEFKLYFKRGDKDRKELTDREFNKFSGGEKAIAMYIPLFSSIYAKLNSADKKAPHIIALDEAFAGVDDANIKDAFRILDKLDIDYVLTSQQLWGDYETVKHLAISELHHPINSKVVSIVKYKWDGVSRRKIDDNSEYQD